VVSAGAGGAPGPAAAQWACPACCRETGMKPGDPMPGAAA
jgi:hypothetical protein